MNTKHVELLRKLEQFQLDSPEASFPFSARLARENDWSPAYARQVINEYKRFSFLAVAAGHPVSPSEDVDQAWHLHLTYSENYWRVFCPEILGHPFHHHPTRGGENESEKFNDWDTRTLQSYEKFFHDTRARAHLALTGRAPKGEARLHSRGPRAKLGDSQTTPQTESRARRMDW